MHTSEFFEVLKIEKHFCRKNDALTSCLGVYFFVPQLCSKAAIQIGAANYDEHVTWVIRNGAFRESFRRALDKGIQIDRFFLHN